MIKLEMADAIANELVELLEPACKNRGGKCMNYVKEAPNEAGGCS